MRKFAVALLTLSIVSFALAQSKSKIVENMKGSTELAKLFASPLESASELETKAIASYSAQKANFALAREQLAYAKLLAAIAKSEVKLPDGLIKFFCEQTEPTIELAEILCKRDKLDQVFKIIADIYSATPADFEQFPRLAFAISIVFDTPPPNNWPHAQVSEKALPRDLGKPLDAFKTRVDFRKRGKALLQTEKLSIEECKYLVAALASKEDAEWAFRFAPITINNVPKLYSSIEYSFSRLNNKQFNWLAGNYALETIKNNGGICVDQAYYTAEVAKLRGLPAFIFSGAGADGYHAWTAYMLRSGKWNFGVGRYEGARFVTGRTFDPQTWQQASDHALNSMRESFRSNPKYATSQLHASFAQTYLAQGKIQEAKLSAKKSIQSDARNADAWDVLISASSESTDKEVEGILKGAIKAFERYPDVEAIYRKNLISRLREKNPAEARKIATVMTAKCKKARPDLSMEFARMELEYDIKEGDLAKLATNTKRILTNFKSTPAMAVTGITVPILNALLKEGKADLCDVVMKATRQVLKSAKDETVAKTLDMIQSQIDSIKGT